MASKVLIRQGEDRRKKILKFIRSYHTKQGFAPSIMEIATASGLVSPNATRTHLQRLEKDGYLRMEPRKARAIHLISPAPDGWSRKA